MDAKNIKTCIEEGQHAPVGKVILYRSALMTISLPFRILAGSQMWIQIHACKRCGTLYLSRS